MLLAPPNSPLQYLKHSAWSKRLSVKHDIRIHFVYSIWAGNGENNDDNDEEMMKKMNMNENEYEHEEEENDRNDDYQECDDCRL